MSKFSFKVFFLLIFSLPSLCLGITKEEGVVNIGVILPLTGDIQTWGEGVRRGLELASEDFLKKAQLVPSLHTRSKFYFEDEEVCNPRKAVDAAMYLIHQKHVDALIPGCLAGYKAFLPQATKAQVPIFSSGLLSGREEEAHPLTISLSGQIASEGIALAKLFSQLKLEHIAIFRLEDEFTSEMVYQIKNSPESKSLKTVLDFTYMASETDFKSGLINARSKNPQAYFVYLGEQQLLSFMRQYHQFKLTQPVFGGYVVESNSLPKEARQELNGITYTYPNLRQDNDPVRIEFIQKFKTRFGKDAEPNANTFYVYDGFTLYLESLNSCQAKDMPCIKSYFYNQGNPHSGISGDFSYFQNGYVNRPFIVKKVVSGRFEVLQEIKIIEPTQ